MSTPVFRISWTFMQTFQMTLTVNEARALFAPDPCANDSMPERSWEAACARQQVAANATSEQLRQMLRDAPELLDDRMCTVEDDEVEHTRRLDGIEVV